MAGNEMAHVPLQNRRTLASLQVLCQKAIQENLQIFEGMEHLFSDLPSDVLECLLRSCPSSITQKMVKLVAHKHTVMLSLTFDAAYSEDPAVICRIIEDKCKNLIALDLIWTNESNEDTYCSLLSSLPHLRKLSFDGPLSDKLLESITSTQLRSLRIEKDTPGVSQESLSQLIQKSTEMETFVAYRFNVNPSIVGEALLSLHNLRILKCKGMDRFVEKVVRENHKVNLLGLSFTKMTPDLVSNFLDTADLSQNFPFLQILSLKQYYDVGPFLKFQHLKEISLSSMPCEFVIHTYASNLTTLHLFHCVDTIDISMLGYFCLNLEKLVIFSSDITPNGFHKLGPEHFLSLKKVAFINVGFVIGYRSVDDRTMLRILNAPKLYSFSSNYVNISNALISQIITESEEKGLLFPEISCFMIPAIEISAENAINLVRMMPKLCHVSFFSMSVVDANIFQQFIDKNISDVRIHNDSEEALLCALNQYVEL